MCVFGIWIQMSADFSSHLTMYYLRRSIIMFMSENFRTCVKDVVFEMKIATLVQNLIHKTIWIKVPTELEPNVALEPSEKLVTVYHSIMINNLNTTLNYLHVEVTENLFVFKYNGHLYSVNYVHHVVHHYTNLEQCVHFVTSVSYRQRTRWFDPQWFDLL